MFQTLVDHYYGIAGKKILLTGEKLLIPTPIFLLLNTLPKDAKERMIVLLSDPTALGHKKWFIKESDLENDQSGSGNPGHQAPQEIGGNRPQPGNTEYTEVPNPWFGIQEFVILTHKLDVVESKFQVKIGEVQKTLNLILRGSPGNLEKWLLLNHPAHPVKWILENLEQVLKDMYRTIALGECPSDAVQTFTDIDYIKSVIYGSMKVRQWKDKKSLRIQGVAQIVWSVYTKCITPGSSTDQVISYDDW